MKPAAEIYDANLMLWPKRHFRIWTTYTEKIRFLYDLLISFEDKNWLMCLTAKDSSRHQLCFPNIQKKESLRALSASGSC